MVPNREGQTLSNKAERAPWHGPGDSEYNLDVANEVIGVTGGWIDSDDITIALHLMGWKIVPLNDDGPPWPMFEPHPLNPPWAVKTWRQDKGAADEVSVRRAAGLCDLGKS